MANGSNGRSASRRMTSAMINVVGFESGITLGEFSVRFRRNVRADLRKSDFSARECKLRRRDGDPDVGAIVLDALDDERLTMKIKIEQETMKPGMTRTHDWNSLSWLRGFPLNLSRRTRRTLGAAVNYSP